MSAPPIPLGPFDLTRVIGRGGMGLVWEAVHRTQGLRVAVKTLRGEAGEEAQVLFDREVRAVAALQHPGIVTVLDHGLVPAETTEASAGQLAVGGPYLVMELCSGGTAKSLVKRVRWPELRDLLHRLLEALAYAHARRVIHKDIKPGNVLLAGDGDLRPGPKLVDFGIAQTLARDRTDTDGPSDNFYGSPSYVAPEQVRVAPHDVGPWTDLYALGCLTWKLATGHPPYRGGTAIAVLEGHLKGELPKFEPEFDAPHGLEAWLQGLLRRDPGDRFQHASDAARALVDVENRRPVPVRMGSMPAPRDWRPLEPPPTRMSLVGAGLGLFGLRTPGLVGREEERDRLWAAARQVVGRRVTRVVLIRGEAGVGKSHLAEWLCDRVEEHGIARTAAAVHSAQTGAADGFGPMLARLLRAEGMPGSSIGWRAEQRLQWLGRPSVRLARALAHLVAPETDEEPMGAGERHAVIAALLDAESRSRPLVLWLDDVQHGPETLDVASALVRRSRLRPTPLLLVMTVREEEVEPGSPIAERLEAVQEWRETTTVRLPALGERAVRDLVSRMLGLSGSLADTVVERASGNPLFAVQLLGDWVARGVLELAEDHSGFVLKAGERAPVPDNIHDLWLHRVEQTLAEHGRALRPTLELASALGQDVELDPWLAACEAAGLDVPYGLVGLLAERGLARQRPGGWRFSHGLLRESLERSARESGRWGALNGAVAKALEDGTDLPRRAGALREAGRIEEAGAAWLEAAREALRRERTDRAASFLARAERLLDDAELERSARAQIEAGLLGLEISAASGQPVDPERLLELRSLAEAEGWDRLAAAAVRLQGTTAAEPTSSEAIAALREAVARSAEGGDRAGEAAATRALGDVLAEAEESEAAPATLRRAAALYESVGDRIGHASTLEALADLLERMDQTPAADAARAMAKRLRL